MLTLNSWPTYASTFIGVKKKPAFLTNNTPADSKFNDGEANYLIPAQSRFLDKLKQMKALCRYFNYWFELSLRIFAKFYTPAKVYFSEAMSCFKMDKFTTNRPAFHKVNFNIVLNISP